jgi:hypothetical protein
MRTSTSDTSPTKEQPLDGPESKTRAVEPLHLLSKRGMSPNSRRSSSIEGISKPIRRRSLLNMIIDHKDNIPEELLKQEVQQEFSIFREKVTSNVNGEENSSEEKDFSQVRDKLEDMVHESTALNRL